MIAVVRSEWTKVRSLRSTVLTAALTVLMATGLGALISRGLGTSYLIGPAEERALFDPVYSVLVGCFALAQLAIGALGVLSVTSEYGTGMIRTSLAAVPRRGRFLAAKALVLGVSALVVGEVAVFAAFFAGQPVLDAVGAPTAGIGDDGVLGALLGGGLWLGGVALYGVAFGVLVRATAGAFALLSGVTLVVPLLAGALPAWFGTWWPTMAGQQIFRTVPDPAMHSGWPGLLLMYGVLAVLFAVAYVVFRRRDA